MNKTIIKLDNWFESMRNTRGYIGKVNHWWDSCLLYDDVMIDWRYEGIICGYVNLYRKTNDKKWLERAINAGNDCVKNQLPTGMFLNSNFQIGAIEGGTPHEQAVDVGLLELAKLLKELKDDRWEKYFLSAEKNIKKFLIKKLWNGEGFTDQPWNNTLVPNKNATIIEVLLLYEELTGKKMIKYIKKCKQLIFNSQIKEGSAKGGFAHQGTFKHQIVFGIYTARTTSALLRLNKYYPDKKIIDICKETIKFLEKLINPKGAYVGYYKNNKLIKNPTFISPSGDFIRAFILAEESGISVDKFKKNQLIKAIEDSQLENGGIKTGYGFAVKGSTKDYYGKEEDRDVLPVVGWCDKVFRGFSLL